MDSLLARFAEDSYWLARYVERAENLARLLDVTESYDRRPDSGSQWAGVLALFADQEAYKARYNLVEARHVMRFYTLDKTNPNSIIASIRFARNNARTLRHLISVEMWTQINVFYNRLDSLRARDVMPARLSRFCMSVKDDCQLFQGCTQNTLYRDQTWHFYRLGRLLERCDQTTRLVDMKAGALLRGPTVMTDAIDLSQWHTLLRAASAYHGYLRRHPREMTPETVAGFVLFDPGYPRSILFAATEMRAVFEQMREFIDDARYQSVSRQFKRLDRLARRSPAKVLESGLHDYLDAVQLELMALHGRLAEAFYPTSA